MSALDHPSAIATGSSASIAGLVRNLVRAFANRRQIEHLRGLTDRGLADIGLMRLDLDFARRAPLGTDPMRRLVSVARERARA